MSEGMNVVEYAPEIDAALQVFRDLRNTWNGVRTSAQFNSEDRVVISRLLTDAHAAAAAADDKVVEARNLLADGSSYADRYDAVTQIDRRSQAWAVECKVVEPYVGVADLEQYLLRAKKTFGRSRRKGLVRPVPFSDERPVSGLANQLSVPNSATNRRDARRYADVQIPTLNAILIVLANSFVATTEFRFDISYSVAVSVAQ